MGIRPYSPADEWALLELWNRSAEFDPLTQDTLREKLADPDPTFALFCDDGFCLGVQRPKMAYVKLLAVAPEARGYGLGTQLLEAMEARLKGPVRICESNPNYLVPGLDVRYTPALLFFEKHGYRKIGETFNLHCDLRGRDFTGSPTGIRRATAKDAPAVEVFLTEHFPGWRYEVAQTFLNDPISLHLAVDGRQILGFSAYDSNNRGTGWFGPMGTAPEARGRGLGARLLHLCLYDLQQQGRQACTIPWVGPYGFYSRHCGACIDRVFWRYEKS